MNEKGMKFDHEKPDWSLLDLDRVEEVVRVLTYGAKKYSPDNWKHVEPHRYLSAAMRHIAAFQRGEAEDSETGISHLAHAQCCLHFLQWFESQEDVNKR
jgi:hypothetical protein